MQYHSLIFVLLSVLSACKVSKERAQPEPVAVSLPEPIPTLFLKQEIDYNTEVYKMRFATLGNSWSNINSQTEILLPQAPLFQPKGTYLPFVYVNFKLPTEMRTSLPEDLQADLAQKNPAKLDLFFYRSVLCCNDRKL